MDIFKIDRASAQDATPSGNFGGQVWMQRLISEQQRQQIRAQRIEAEPLSVRLRAPS